MRDAGRGLIGALAVSVSLLGCAVSQEEFDTTYPLSDDCSKGPVMITDANFSAYASQTPIVVDFSASWCLPCRMYTPTFHEVAETSMEKYGVCMGRYDVDAESGLQRRMGVASIPTTVFFDGDKAIEKHSGIMTKRGLNKSLEKHYNNS